MVIVGDKPAYISHILRNDTGVWIGMQTDWNENHAFLRGEAAAAPVVYSETALYFGVTLRTRSDALATAYFAARRENDERLLAAWEPVRTRRAEVAERYDRLSALWREWEEERSCR